MLPARSGAFADGVEDRRYLVHCSSLPLNDVSIDARLIPFDVRGSPSGSPIKKKDIA